MNISQKLKGLLAVALFAFAVVGANAADFKTLTIPTVAAGGTSNAIGAVLTLDKQSNVALAWNSSSTNVLVRLSASVDNSTWMTNYYVLQLGTAAAAAPVITNLNNAGVLYLRVDSVLNTGTINATNTVRYGYKPGA